MFFILFTSFLPPYFPLKRYFTRTLLGCFCIFSYIEVDLIYCGRCESSLPQDVSISPPRCFMHFKQCFLFILPICFNFSIYIFQPFIRFLDSLCFLPSLALSWFLLPLNAHHFIIFHILSPPFFTSY